MRKKLKVAGILAFILIGGAAGFYLRADMTRILSGYLRPAEEDPVPMLKVNERDYDVIVTADGELTGFQVTPVPAPRIRTGSLKIGWMVKEGAIIRKGDLIVRFDNSDAMLKLKENENSVDSVKSRITKSEEDGRSQKMVYGLDGRSAEMDLDFARKQIRNDAEIFSRWEIEESVISAALADYKKVNIEKKGSLNETLNKADLRMLGVDRRKAESEMALAKETLDSLELRSPVEGVVVYKRNSWNPIDVGSEVWSGQPLVDVANVSQFKARVNVVESDAASVDKGKSAQIALNSFPTRLFTGTITSVSTAAQQFSRRDPRKYFECEVVLDVPTEFLVKLKPGMKLRADIVVGSRKRAIVLPKSAVIKKNGGFSVFTGENGSYKEVPVKILDGDYGFYVLEGVRSGQQVCLQHPFEKQKLKLPDFSAPAAATQGRRFTIVY